MTRREEWEREPHAWNRQRIAHVSRTVARNWADMTAFMRERVRRQAERSGPALIVDIGCGNGGFSDGLDDAIRMYVGVDPSVEMLGNVRRSRQRRYALGVGEHVPLADAIADVVVLKTVLAHCFSPNSVVREAARVARPGGITVVSTGNRGAWYQVLRDVRRRFLRARGGSDGHLFGFTEDELARLLTDAGWSVTERRQSGYLVLPRFVDRWLPNVWVDGIARMCDALGARLLPKSGGVLVLVGVKSA
ncbi:methyltransferase domain-containing protein [Candidatus Poribacteria bacterium]|nr:methyltransferase domain-containing protein [Candidatus Poribacteria bacterium]